MIRSAELSWAINSMFAWYESPQLATSTCPITAREIGMKKLSGAGGLREIGHLGNPWRLGMLSYSSRWTSIGSGSGLSAEISAATCIPKKYLIIQPANKDWRTYP